ncbi:aminopeptidase, partial [Deinococcus sp. MIMF12]|nr:aminopeptidase [Deinococcus rhizophilus]
MLYPRTVPTTDPSPALSYDPAAHAALLADYCLSAAPGERLLVAGGVS